MAVVDTITIEALFNGKDVQKGLKKLDKSLFKLQKGFGKQFSKLLKFAGVAGFTKMAIDAAQFGRSMGLLADKTGIAVDKLTSMRTAFSALGSDAKSVDNLLSNITSGLARLSMGEGEYAAKLAAMGISAWDNQGNVKQADAVMGDLADWTKSQLAMGRSMAEVSTYLKDNFGIEQDMVKQLALGRAGMKAEVAKQNKRTGTVSGLEIANLESLNRSFATLKTTVGVLIDKVMAGLAPVIEFFTDLLTIAFKNLQDSFKYLFDSFADIVGEGDEVAKLFQFLKTVMMGFGFVVRGIVDVVKGFFEAVKKIGEWFGEFLAWLQNSWLGKMLGVEQEKDADLGTMEERIDKRVAEGGITKEQGDALKTKLGIKKEESLFPAVPKPTTKDLITGKEINFDGTPVIKEEKVEEPIISEEIIEFDEYNFEQPINNQDYSQKPQKVEKKIEPLFTEPIELTTKDLIGLKDVYMDGTPVEKSSITNNERIENSKSIYKNIENNKSVENYKNIENSDVVENYYNTENNEDVENYENIENSETNEQYDDYYELTGREVTQADNVGSAPVVNLEVNTNAEFNEATGQIEQKVDINGQSENSGAEPINYMYQSVRG